MFEFAKACVEDPNFLVRVTAEVAREYDTAEKRREFFKLVAETRKAEAKLVSVIREIDRREREMSREAKRLARAGAVPAPVAVISRPVPVLPAPSIN